MIGHDIHHAEQTISELENRIGVKKKEMEGKTKPSSRCRPASDKLFGEQIWKGN